jgi:hypothetical protein
MRERLRAILLAALLLIPLVTSGHHHAADATTGSCAICVVAHHTPATVAPPTASVAPSSVHRLTIVATIEAPEQRVHSPIAGRAPPFSSTVLAIS